MPPRTVIYDACVLHPPSLRDLLIRLADAGLVFARWTDQILDEAFESIRRRHPHLDAARLLRTRRMMCDAVPDCLVTEYDGLADAVVLPDVDDRHVVAAAIRCGARSIVTFNLKDFPAATLAPFDIEAVHPDEFIAALFTAAPEAVVGVLHQQACVLRDPPRTVPELLDTLERSGLARSMALVRTALRD